MAIYIYRSGGSGPEPQNPIIRFLVGLAVIVGMIGFGILLLPVVGAVALFILGLIVCLVIGGFIYRAIYGDPWQRMREMQEGMRVNPQRHSGGEKSEQSNAGCRPKRFGACKQDIEDAVIVEEKTHR